MDFRNKPIPAEQITSVDANKSLKRCLVKACALHGLGLYIYRGEDLPEEMSKLLELQEEVAELARKRSALSDKAKEVAIKLCVSAEKEANPQLDESLITGKISNINNIDILEQLKIKLTAVKK